MNFDLRLRLQTSPQQLQRLQALQTAFAEVCNALAPIVREHRCWNRVALHHLAYRRLRERFPQIGSQMVCNAIYSVSRTCRVVLQNPNSPWCIDRRAEQPLPLLRFLPSAPVYFDRHTLSLKDGQLSMYTLDGRMRFDLALQNEAVARFHREKIREIVLSRDAEGYQLAFMFDAAGAVVPEGPAEMPEYVLAFPDEEGHVAGVGTVAFDCTAPVSDEAPLSDAPFEEPVKELR